MAKLVDLDGLAYFYGKIKAMLAEKLGKNDVATVAKSGSYNDLTNKPTIPIVPSNVSAFTNDAGYLTRHQSLDGYVKSVNGTKPDGNGNVTIAVDGGVKTDTANTWTAEQDFKKINITYESYTASSVSGTSATPTASTAVYTATGNFTLDLNSVASNLANGQTTVFTARINADADYALSINVDGVISYIGKASDVAITSAGLLLNVFISRLDNSVTCIVQASKLS